MALEAVLEEISDSDGEEFPTLCAPQDHPRRGAWSGIVPACSSSSKQDRAWTAPTPARPPVRPPSALGKIAAPPDSAEQLWASRRSLPTRDSDYTGLGLHTLLKQKPQVLKSVKFLSAEVFVDLDMDTLSPGEGAYGLPSGSDVIVSFSLENAALGGEELVILQGYVRRFVRQLQSGCKCYVVFGGSRQPDSIHTAELRLWVLLYADMVITLSGNVLSRSPSFDSLPTLLSLNTIEKAQKEKQKEQQQEQEAKEPFGPVDSVPEDQRGRVWLERLVMIVKIAMVGNKAPLDQIVMSNSKQTRACISRGAEAISQALYESESDENCSKLDDKCSKGRSPLQRVLEWYLGQLVGALPETEELTRKLATRFISKLSDSWQDESSLQQRRLKYMLQACAQDYAFNWLVLSPERMDSIRVGSRADPLPVLIVGILPIIVALGLFGMPYSRPDAGFPDAGWQRNLFFVLYCWPVTQFTCWILFPEWLRMSAFPDLRLHYACGWTISVTAIVSAGISIFSVMTGVFPIPFLTVVNMACITPFFPLMWFCIPYDVRQQPGAKRKVFWSTVGICLLIAIFGMFFPLFNTLFQMMAGVHQSYMVFFFLATRVAFEKINKMLAKKLSADMFPLTVMLAVYAYEFAMCVMMSSIRHTFVIIVLIGADLAENMIHLWCLHKKASREDPVEVVQGPDDPPQPFPGSDGSRVCLVSVLLVREFVELVVPLQLIVIILTLQFGPGKPFNELVSGFEHGLPNELLNVLRYLVIDVVAEAAVFTIASLVLRAQGFRPLRLLRGVLSANLGSYFTIALGCVMFYLQLQHSHFGCDFSFKFAWVQADTASWQHGLQWAT